MDMLWPNGSTEKPHVTSPFGPRNIDVPNASKNHKGVDLVGFEIIRAVASGQVKIAGVRSGWTGLGNSVWVQHDGFFSKSGHAARVLVRPGQFVRAGDPLCVMGKTGTASDVHLHLEITPGTIHFWNTGQVDPVAFINARLGTTAGGSTGLPAGEEDDMFEDEDRALLAEVLTEVRNTKAGVWTGGKSGGQTFRYGALPIVAHNQTLIGKLTVQVGALSAAVGALAASKGADPKVILAAVEAGVKNAMKDVTFSIDVDG